MCDKVSTRIINGNCLDVLSTLDAESVQCCVTSPPYFGLRDYGVAGQIGLEPMPDVYVAQLVAVFGQLRRVLRDDGTLWLNLGDSYANDTKWGGSSGGKHVAALHGNTSIGRGRRSTGLKSKDLMMIPARVAIALQEDGWYLRSDIIWAKPNSMPEPVTDRPTSSHEHVFLLTKSARYFYDEKAIREPSLQPIEPFRNSRNVWTIATQGYKGAHFATMPAELAERCIKAGSKPGDMILDPFGGAGTTGLVADRLGRSATVIELNSEYANLARQRVANDAPLFAEVS